MIWLNNHKKIYQKSIVFFLKEENKKKQFKVKNPHHYIYTDI